MIGLLLREALDRLSVRLNMYLVIITTININHLNIIIIITDPGFLFKPNVMATRRVG